MTVWVVEGEYAQDQKRGKVVWVAGVGKTHAAAVVLAREDAASHQTEDKESMLAIIDGERVGPWPEGDAEASWDVYYTINEHEVRSA